MKVNAFSIHWPSEGNTPPAPCSEGLVRTSSVKLHWVSSLAEGKESYGPLLMDRFVFFSDCIMASVDIIIVLGGSVTVC